MTWGWSTDFDWDEAGTFLSVLQRKVKRLSNRDYKALRAYMTGTYIGDYRDIAEMYEGLFVEGLGAPMWIDDTVRLANNNYDNFKEHRMHVVKLMRDAITKLL